MDTDKKRKHRMQMSYDEIATVEKIIHSVPRWKRGTIDFHLQKQGRTFTGAEVLEALQRGQVIEVNSLNRVLFRSRKGICVVASIPDFKVVTVWRNNPGDNHKTLKRGEYTWRVNAAEYIEGLVSNGRQIHIRETAPSVA